MTQERHKCLLLYGPEAPWEIPSSETKQFCIREHSGRKKTRCAIPLESMHLTGQDPESLRSTPPPPMAREPLLVQGLRGFTITLRHTTPDRPPQDEWSVRRSDLYLTTHNTHNRQTPILPAGFEPAIPASGRPATGIGLQGFGSYKTEKGGWRLWLHSLKVAQLLQSAACLHTNQSRSYLNHLVYKFWEPQPAADLRVCPGL